MDDSSSDSEVAKVRGRLELASILNFLNVFEPMIGNDLKLTTEEIELGLVKPNALHIKLLKGIPPVSKLLNGSDAWVTALCKKLAMWWPWVRQIFSIVYATFMVIWMTMNFILICLIVYYCRLLKERFHSLLVMGINDNILIVLMKKSTLYP